MRIRLLGEVAVAPETVETPPNDDGLPARPRSPPGDVVQPGHRRVRRAARPTAIGPVGVGRGRHVGRDHPIVSFSIPAGRRRRSSGSVPTGPRWRRRDPVDLTAGAQSSVEPVESLADK